MSLEVSVTIFKEPLLTCNAFIVHIARECFDSIEVLQITIVVLHVFFSKDEYQMTLFKKWKSNNNSSHLHTPACLIPLWE